MCAGLTRRRLCQPRSLPFSLPTVSTDYKEFPLTLEKMPLRSALRGVAVAVAVVCALVSVMVLPTAAADAALDTVAVRFGLAEPAMLKLKVRELKEMLRRKGASCDACVSKRDLVDRIVEVKEWNDVEEENVAEKESQAFGDGTDAEKDERLRKLSEELKKGAGGKNGPGIKIMGPDGSFRNIDNIEDFIKEQGGNPRKNEDSLKSAEAGKDANADLNDEKPDL